MQPSTDKSRESSDNPQVKQNRTNINVLQILLKFNNLCTHFRISLIQRRIRRLNTDWQEEELGMEEGNYLLSNQKTADDTEGSYIQSGP